MTFKDDDTTELYARVLYAELASEHFHEQDEAKRKRDELARYKFADRTIVRDGVEVLRISRVGSDSEGYTIPPSETDELGRTIVAALNAYESVDK